MSTVAAAPFTPINEKSRADMLEEHIKDLPTGSVLRYDDLTLPFSLAEQRGAVATVTKRLEKKQRRTLANVSGIGYKIVAGPDHVIQTNGFLRKTIKGARRTQHSAVAVDSTEMSGVEQARLVELQLRVAFLAKAAAAASKTAEAAAVTAKEIAEEAQEIANVV